MQTSHRHEIVFVEKVLQGRLLSVLISFHGGRLVSNTRRVTVTFLSCGSCESRGPCFKCTFLEVGCLSDSSGLLFRSDIQTYTSGVFLHDTMCSRYDKSREEQRYS